jgi:RNA polymerase subunit RPABC4/transcription elongation factor Spt4
MKTPDLSFNMAAIGMAVILDVRKSQMAATLDVRKSQMAAILDVRKS